ncbi:hypothetical protein KA107_00915 [Candidatus Pacearchaeota archaeon]|nr:hypothetical protein [Candidatus Pacearchaeota archaeon]
MPARRFRKLEQKRILGVPIPWIRSFWQKSSQRGGTGLIFNPNDYEAETPTEARRMAYEDAQNHADFYKELAEKDLLPPGTTAKAKRMRHSGSYHVEIVMPHVSMTSGDVLQDVKASPSYRNGDGEFIRHSRANVARDIQRIARKHGYIYQEHVPSTMGFVRDFDREFSSDMQDSINYRFSGPYGKRYPAHYIDSEILVAKLPYPGRKPDLIEQVQKRNAETRQELEKKFYSIAAILGLGGSLFFSTSSFTGNVISSLSNTASTGAGIVLFFIGIVCAMFSLANKKKYS